MSTKIGKSLITRRNHYNKCQFLVVEFGHGVRAIVSIQLSSLAPLFGVTVSKNRIVNDIVVLQLMMINNQKSCWLKKRLEFLWVEGQEFKSCHFIKSPY